MNNRCRNTRTHVKPSSSHLTCYVYIGRQISIWGFWFQGCRSGLNQVSSNTGRVHLFRRSSDGHSRPTSLQANFKPEDLALFAENGICERGALPAWLIFSASHREAAILFLDEYNRLRPVLRNRLRGRPLSLPLETELKSYKDKDHYVAGVGFHSSLVKPDFIPIRVMFFSYIMLF